MHPIKTLSNNKIKEITKLHQKKYRDEAKLFIAEGKKIFEEVLREKVEIVEIYALETFKPTKKADNITFISESEMKKISTTASACDVLVIAKQKEYHLNEIKGNKIILFDRISDPGNLGTIIRSAAAFNIDGIILYGDCVEIYSPKVIRSCAGNFFKTPIARIKNLKELKDNFNGYTFISTALRQGKNIEPKELKNIEKAIIMLGAEADGLNNDLIKIADKNVLLKMNKNVESLNLSVSASILMYELF